jgi:hypothetical protein
VGDCRLKRQKAKSAMVTRPARCPFFSHRRRSDEGGGREEVGMSERLARTDFIVARNEYPHEMKRQIVK